MIEQAPHRKSHRAQQFERSIFKSAHQQSRPAARAVVAVSVNLSSNFGRWRNNVVHHPARRWRKQIIYRVYRKLQINKKNSSDYSSNVHYPFLRPPEDTFLNTKAPDPSPSFFTFLPIYSLRSPRQFLGLSSSLKHGKCLIKASEAQTFCPKHWKRQPRVRRILHFSPFHTTTLVVVNDGGRQKNAVKLRHLSLFLMDEMRWRDTINFMDNSSLSNLDGRNVVGL